MKSVVYLLLGILMLGCSSYKKANKAYLSGNYHEAFYTVLERLKKSPSESQRGKLIPILQKSYEKAVKNDENRIEFLAKEGNPENYKEIYYTLLDLQKMQQRLDPFLPMQYRGKTVKFSQKNYDNALLKAKEDLVSYTYNKTQNINWNDKGAVRNHYNDLKFAASLSPNYKQINQKLDELHYAGTDFVLISLNNESNQIIPRALEDELLNISAYRLSSFWTEYHTQENRKLDYDLALNLNFKQIRISPEQVNQRTFVKEKDIVDGTETLYENGQAVRDSLGNAIQVDRYITVSCEVNEFHQWKQAQVIAEVEAIDVRSRETIERFPIESTYVFENYYGEVLGDRRALDDVRIRRMGRTPMPFPSNEQMVYNCGEDLKNQFKRVLRDIAN